MTAARPLVLVHGWAGSFDHTWRRAGLVDLLADAGRSVVAYDLPGHGNARKSHDPHDYSDMAGDLLAHVATLRTGGSNAAGEMPRVDAVGFSLGAITLLRALVREPNSFGTVMLAGIGGIIPILANLIVLDLEAVFRDATALAVISYCLRVMVLYAIGGLGPDDRRRHGQVRHEWF